MTIKLSANGQEITLMKLDKPSGDLHSHLAKETKSLEKKGQDQLTNKTMPRSTGGVREISLCFRLWWLRVRVETQVCVFDVTWYDFLDLCGTQVQTHTSPC